MTDTPNRSSHSSSAVDDGDHGEDIVLLVILPFMGPGIEPETGQLRGPPQSDYVMHSTELRLKPEPEAAARFERWSALILEQLAGMDGLVGFSFGYQPHRNVFRTIGVWKSEQAMNAFVPSGAHQAAMSGADSVSFRTRGHHWEIPASELPPTWDAAIAGLAAVDSENRASQRPVVKIVSLVDPSLVRGKTPHEIFQAATHKLREMSSPGQGA